TAADIMSKMDKSDFEEKSAGKLKINKPKSGGRSFCVVNSTTVLYSNDADTIKAVVERDKMPEWSTGMQTALKKASRSTPHTPIPPGGQKLEWSIDERDWGSDTRHRRIAEFSDKEAAEKAKKATDDSILQGKGELEKLGLTGEVTFSVSISGNTVTE